jgi:heme oxygenase
MLPEEPRTIADEIPVPDVRKALQHATAHLHAEVDSALPLSFPAPTLADYQEHLAVLRDWMTKLQIEHPALSAQLYTHQERLRVDLEICAELFSGKPFEMPSALPASLLPAVTAPSAAVDWGIAYVIEGSQLGGQVLHRRLAESLAPHPLGYLKGEGSATGRHWTAFLNNLRLQVVTPAQQADACRGAVQAFEGLLHCFRARRVDGGSPP